MFGINYVDTTEVHNTGKLRIDWSSQHDTAGYLDLALDMCKTYDAKYLALGIGNNFHYRYSPETFDLWVEAYKNMYDEVKKEYLETKVFVTFQYEMTKGVGTKYWGEHDPEWEILDKFGDKLDIIAFTTYPELEYSSIEEIPEDYYSEIKNYSNKPVSFTEIGWQDDDGTFISKFLELTESLNKEFILWIFMHDTKMTENNPLPGVGLREYDGSPKQAWHAWKELKEVPYEND